MGLPAHYTGAGADRSRHSVEVVLSLGVLAAFTARAVLLTTRLFRTYLLMYGQRPRIGHILRTLWSG